MNSFTTIEIVALIAAIIAVFLFIYTYICEHYFFHSSPDQNKKLTELAEYARNERLR